MPSAESRQQTLELNGQLREALSSLQIRNTPIHTILTAQQHAAPLEGRYPDPVEARLDRRAWARAATRAGRRPRRPAAWTDEEIIAALQDWTARHGQPPNSCQWLAGSPDRPSSLCVRRRFGSWQQALKHAGLKPNPRAQHRYWKDEEILASIRAWTQRHGRAPRAKDWTRASLTHPCSRSVTTRFGTFKAGVATAQPQSQPRR